MAEIFQKVFTIILNLDLFVFGVLLLLLQQVLTPLQILPPQKYVKLEGHYSKHLGLGR